MPIEEALELMRSYFTEDRQVTHTERVVSQAQALLEAVSSGVSRQEFVSTVVQLAAVFHDIGIPNALRRHGSAAGPYQEKEGAALVPQFLAKLETREDIAARVTYIVGNHHTREAVDGIDFQILWDADMLVNLRESNITPDRPTGEFIAEQFETTEGARRAKVLLADQSP